MQSLRKNLKKITLIPKLIKNEGLDAFYYRILSNLGFKLKYRSIIEKQKYLLQQKLINLSKKKVISGIYKDLHLNCRSNWDNYSFSSKLLGTYEEQVQLKIKEISLEKNLTNIVQFGSADGYHILGLLKNNILKYGYAFEIDKISYEFSLDNQKQNNLENNLEILNEKASLESIDKYLKEKDLEKTLFLIDIEGEEYELFNESNIKKYNKSFFVIEDHFFYDYKNKRNNFYELIKKNFDISLLPNSGRNPFKFEILDKFNDDEKWLLMGEGRPQSMNWIILQPK